jgi:hypothetical protein
MDGDILIKKKANEFGMQKMTKQSDRNHPLVIQSQVL